MEPKTADLVVELREAVPKGGRDGPVLVPYRPDESHMIKKVKRGEKLSKRKRVSFALLDFGPDAAGDHDPNRNILT